MTHFSLRVLPSEKVEAIISVSKKVSKSAVVRNSVKRRVRPILKRILARPAKYLLVAKPGAEGLRGRELEDELKSLVVGRKL